MNFFLLLLQGLGTDEKAIIAVLCHRSNEQRQEIEKVCKRIAIGVRALGISFFFEGGSGAFEHLVFKATIFFFVLYFTG